MNSRGSNSHIITAFLFFALTLAGCRSASTDNQPDQESQPAAETNAAPPFDVPGADIDLARPLQVSQRPDDVALCEKINRKIEESPYSNARWGVFAVSLKDGRVVCSRDGRKLFNPASIQKTLTAIVALDRLGADYRWRTSVYAANPIEADGTLNGDLVLYGQGAPDFDAAGMDNLIAQLQAKGLRRVRGNVIGDESYFRGDNIGDGWTWNELQWWYGAEASALSFNDNVAFINVENGAGRVSNDYVQVTMGQDQTADNANTEAAGIKRGLSDNNFYVWGNQKNFGSKVAVYNPAGMAAKTFKEKLEKKGIAVEGATATRDWKTPEKLDPAKATELAHLESQTLAEVVKKMNKQSVNLYAELLLRTIGKKFGDSVPTDIQEPQDVRGDDTAGAAVMKKWLLEHNIAAGEVAVLDGSGLSRLDFMTPESFARAFIFAARAPYAPAFTDSLPIAATDGTLGGRLGKVKGRVLAKTGSIMYVNSLAGYIDQASGEVWTFAVITNNDTRRGGAVAMIDQVVTMLADGAAEKDAAANQNINRSVNQNANENANRPNFVLEKQGR